MSDTEQIIISTEKSDAGQRSLAMEDQESEQVEPVTPSVEHPSLFELIRSGHASNTPLSASNMEELVRYFHLILAECDRRPKMQGLLRVLAQCDADETVTKAIKAILLQELKRVTLPCKEGGRALGSYHYRRALLTVLTHDPKWILSSEFQNESFLLCLSWLVGTLFIDCHEGHVSKHHGSLLDKQLLQVFQTMETGAEKAIHTLCASSLSDPNLYHAKMLSLLFESTSASIALEPMIEYYSRNVVIAKTRLPFAAMMGLSKVLSLSSLDSFNKYLFSPLQKMLLRSPELAIHVICGTFQQLSLDATDSLKAFFLSSLTNHMKSAVESVRADAVEALKHMLHLVDAHSEASVLDMVTELLKQAYGKVGLELKLALLELLCELRLAGYSEKVMALIISYAAKEVNDASLDLLIKSFFHFLCSHAGTARAESSGHPSRLSGSPLSFLLAGLASDRRDLYLGHLATTLVHSSSGSEFFTGPELSTAAQRLLAKSESLVALSSLHCILSAPGANEPFQGSQLLVERYMNEKVGLLKEKSLCKQSEAQSIVVMHSCTTLLLDASVADYCKHQCCQVLFYFAAKKERLLSDFAFRSLQSVARHAIGSTVLPKCFSTHVRAVLFSPDAAMTDATGGAESKKGHERMISRLLHDWVAHGEASLCDGALVASLVPLHHVHLCPLPAFTLKQRASVSRLWLKLVARRRGPCSLGTSSFVAEHRSILVREALTAALFMENDAASSRLWSKAGFSALGALLTIHPTLIGLSLVPTIREMLEECLSSAATVSATDLAIWQHDNASRPFVDVLLKKPSQPKKVESGSPPPSLRKGDDKAWEAQLRSELELKKVQPLTREEKALVEQQLLLEKTVRARLDALLAKLRMPLSLACQLFERVRDNMAPELESQVPGLFRLLVRLLQKSKEGPNLFLAHAQTEALIQKSLLSLAACVRLTPHQNAVPPVVYYIGLCFQKTKPAWIQDTYILELFEKLCKAKASVTASMAGLPLVFPLLHVCLCDAARCGISEATRKSAFELLDSFIHVDKNGPNVKWVEDGLLAKDVGRLLFHVMDFKSAFRFDARKSLRELVALLQAERLSISDKSLILDMICERLVDADPFVRSASLQGLQLLKPLESEASASLKALLWMSQFDVESEVQLLAQELLGQLEDLSLVSAMSGHEAVSSLVPFLSHRVESVAMAAGKGLAALTHVRPELTLSTMIQIFGLYEAIVSPVKEAPKHLKPRLILGLEEDWKRRAFLAYALKEMAALMSMKAVTMEGTDEHDELDDRQGVEEAIEPLFLFLIDSGLTDVTESVRQVFLEAGLIVIQDNGAFVMDALLSIFDTSLQQLSSASAAEESGLDPSMMDLLRTSIVIFIGSLGRHLSKGDARIESFSHRLMDLLGTPSQVVQESVAGCLAPLLGALEPATAVSDIAEEFKRQLFSSDASFAARKGAAYGLAALVKGRGVLAIKTFDLFTAMLDAMQASKGKSEARLGSLMLLDACLVIVGRVFEPYVGEALPHLLSCFGDSSSDVRAAASDASRSLMRSLSGPCLRLLLPRLLESLAGGRHWRSKASTVELLAALSYLDTAQLSESIFVVIPKIVADALSDSHPTVQKMAQSTLSQLGHSVSVPEVKSLVPFIVLALAEPTEHLTGCLNALAQTSFSHYVDAMSLALLAPVLERGLRERSSELKKKAAQAIGNLCCLAPLKDLSLFLPPLLPLLQKALLDPVPGTRDMAAKALGVVVRTLSSRPTTACPATDQALIDDLFHALRTSASSVDRAGAAQGLSEIFFALGKKRLEASLPFILSLLVNKPQLPFDREGALILSYYLPCSFGLLFVPYVSRFFMPLLLAGSESELGREVSREACRNLIALYAHIPAIDVALEYGRERLYVMDDADLDKAVPEGRTRILVTRVLLMNMLEGFGSLNWRVRHASIELLDRLIEVRFPHASSIGNTPLTAALMPDDASVEGPVVVASVSTGSGLTAQAQRVAAIHRMLFRTLADDYGQFIAWLYLIRFDQHSAIRQASLVAWKSIVEHTPRTLREVLSVLLLLIVKTFGEFVVSEAEQYQTAAKLSSSVDLSTLLFENEMAARAFSDLLSKLGDRLLLNIMKEVTGPALLGSDHPTIRAGVSIAVIELIMSPTTREPLLAVPVNVNSKSYRLKVATGAVGKLKSPPSSPPPLELGLESLKRILSLVICDAHPAVRFAAARAISVLYEQSGRSSLQSLVEGLLLRIFERRSEMEALIQSDSSLDSASQDASWFPVEGFIALFSFIDTEVIVPLCLPFITKEVNQGPLSCYLFRRLLKASGSSISFIPSLIAVALPMVLQFLASELREVPEQEWTQKLKKSLYASVLLDWMRAYSAQPKTQGLVRQSSLSMSRDQVYRDEADDGLESDSSSESGVPGHANDSDVSSLSDRDEEALSDDASIESFFKAIHTHFVESEALCVGSAAGLYVCLYSALHEEGMHALLSIDTVTMMLASLAQECFNVEEGRHVKRTLLVREALQCILLFGKKYFQEEYMVTAMEVMDEIDVDAVQTSVMPRWPEALVAFIPLYTQALLSCGEDENIRVRSAVAIREVIDLSDATVLGPHVMSLAGPLIRVLGERLGAEVRSAILATLVQLQTKAGALLKAFVPQLLRVYLKALVELTTGSSAARRGREAAGNGLALLVPFMPRMDPLMNELHGILSCVWESMSELDAESPARADELELLQSLVRVAVLAAQKSGHLPNAAEWQSLLKEIQGSLIAQEIKGLDSDCHQALLAFGK